MWKNIAVHDSHKKGQNNQTKAVYFRGTTLGFATYMGNEK